MGREIKRVPLDFNWPSPITPVFATPEDLAQWCVKNDNGRYGLAGPGSRPDYDGWMSFIESGWESTLAVERAASVEKGKSE